MSFVRSCRPVLINCTLAFFTVVLGRWTAGDGFGAILWAGFVLPIIALTRGRHHSSLAWQTTSDIVTVLAGVAGLIGMGTVENVAETAAVLVTAATFIASVGRLAPAARVSAILLWTGWYAMPCWTTLQRSGGGLLIQVQPLLVLNAIWHSMGDWSHQAIAYRWLTRLGQDVAFEWPVRSTIFIGLTGCAVCLLAAVRRIADVARRRCSTWNRTDPVT